MNCFTRDATFDRCLGRPIAPRQVALSLLLAFPWAIASLLVPLSAGAVTETSEDRPDGCPPAALDRLQKHRVAPGETLNSIASDYGLLPATLMGLNPSLRDGDVQPGEAIDVPPFDGIRINRPPGQTWRDIARTYRLRPGALFEVNGCQPPPDIIFIPGATWSPVVEGRDPQPSPHRNNDLTHYPLLETSDVLAEYGWRFDSATQERVFSSSIALNATANEKVRTVGPGVVAFAGFREGYGNLIIVNHSYGRQTRYGNLGSIEVVSGQPLEAGDTLGTIDALEGYGDRSYLLFEIRYNSSVGWVAQDPNPYLEKMNFQVRRVE